MTDMEIGAFPFTIKKGKLMIMIITNCSGRAWILPKGQPESDKGDAHVAHLEAYEEAGVIGKQSLSRRHRNFKRKDGGFLSVYPLKIRKVLGTWPEKNTRKRALVSVKEALSRVNRREHVDAIIYFSKPENMKRLAKQ